MLHVSGNTLSSLYINYESRMNLVTYNIEMHVCTQSLKYIDRKKVRIISIRTTDIVSDNNAGLQRISLGTGLVGGILVNDWWPNSEYARQCFYPAACWLGTTPQSIQLFFRSGMYGLFWYNLVN
jgi:hypothetical protein